MVSGFQVVDFPRFRKLVYSPQLSWTSGHSEAVSSGGTRTAPILLHLDMHFDWLTISAEKTATATPTLFRGAPPHPPVQQIPNTMRSGRAILSSLMHKRLGSSYSGVLLHIGSCNTYDLAAISWMSFFHYAVVRQSIGGKLVLGTNRARNTTGNGNNDKTKSNNSEVP